jgi:hypothetical protein
MGLAVYLDDPDTGYSFDAFELRGRIEAEVVPTGSGHSATVQRYGLVFLGFEADAQAVTLDASANVASRLVLGGRSAEVVELVPNEPFDVSAAPRVLLLTATNTAAVTVRVD